jgi:hypothetical protein
LQVHLEAKAQLHLRPLWPDPILDNRKVWHQYGLILRCSLRLPPSLTIFICDLYLGIWLANTAFTEDACRPWATFQVLGNVPILVFVSALLSLRLHAIYDKNKIVS